MHGLEASKATQGMIEVNTQLGKRVYTVPTSARQVMRSPEMMQWIDADKVALRALLVGGNELIRRDMVPAGASIGHAVSARRIKVDQATGEHEKFKSRHAYDGKRMRALLARMGLPPPPTGTCNIVGDFTLNSTVHTCRVGRPRAMRPPRKDKWTLCRCRRGLGVRPFAFGWGAQQPHVPQTKFARVPVYTYVHTCRVNHRT